MDWRKEILQVEPHRALDEKEHFLLEVYCPQFFTQLGAFPSLPFPWRASSSGKAHICFHSLAL